MESNSQEIIGAVPGVTTEGDHGSMSWWEEAHQKHQDQKPEQHMIWIFLPSLPPLPCSVP